MKGLIRPGLFGHGTGAQVECPENKERKYSQDKSASGEGPGA